MAHRIRSIGLEQWSRKYRKHRCWWKELSHSIPNAPVRGRAQTPRFEGAPRQLLASRVNSAKCAAFPARKSANACYNGGAFRRFHLVLLIESRFLPTREVRTNRIFERLFLGIHDTRPAAQSAVRFHISSGQKADEAAGCILDKQDVTTITQKDLDCVT